MLNIASPNPKAHEIRPAKRDLGFILLGVSLGMCFGTAFSGGDYHVFLISFTIGLSLLGVRLICSAGIGPSERSHL